MFRAKTRQKEQDKSAGELEKPSYLQNFADQTNSHQFTLNVLPVLA